MSGSNSIFTPGVIVKHPAHPEWGEGQVQSNTGSRITVNFREAGKQLIDASQVSLTFVSF